MFICWKKSIGTSLVYSICFACIYIAVTNGNVENILLYLAAGIVTALLSKAERKGLAIGTVFLIIYCVCFMPTEQKVYEKLGYNPSLMKDYFKYIENVSGEVLVPDDLTIYENNEDGIKYINPKEFKNEIKKMVNTPSVVILREMLIGFILLLLIPNTIYRKYERVANGEIWNTDEFLERKFKEHFILRLNPGNPNVEKAETENKETEKKQEKPKNSNKNKKQKKKN